MHKDLAYEVLWSMVRMLVGRLRAVADARYTDPGLDLVAAAADLGLSRTRLVHAFRELVGVTPHRYVVELRTAHAAHRLRETADPVTRICFDSGFGSVARFLVAFRRAFGTTPSDYRALAERSRTFREVGPPMAG